MPFAPARAHGYPSRMVFTTPRRNVEPRALRRAARRARRGFLLLAAALLATASAAFAQGERDAGAELLMRLLSAEDAPFAVTPALEGAGGAASLRSAAGDLARRHGPPRAIVPSGLGYLIEFDQIFVPADISFDAEGRVAGLLFRAAQPKAASLQAAAEGTLALDGTIALLVREGARDLVAARADERLAVGSQTGFCYWATDPSDNPDYDKFILDHYEVTGALPQTTTAAPLKDVALTRRIMALFGKYRSVTNRFSVVNLKMLERIHATFTADELMGVELVLQNRESLTTKASAGRAAEYKAKQLASGKSGKIAEIEMDHSTIACVSGFLVNMVNKTVRLVSPTRAGERWPLGYRVYAEAAFSTPEEYRAVLQKMMDDWMPEQLHGTHILRFRPDLAYHRYPDGFELVGHGYKHVVRGLDGAGLLGDAIHKGNKTAGEICEMAVRAGGDIFVVTDALSQFFEQGFFDDDPKHGTIMPVPAETDDAAAIA